SLIEVPETFAAYQWNVSNANNYILGVEEAGNYAVTVTDSNGCTTTDEIEVVEAEDPNGQILTSTGGTVLCEGTFINLAAPLGYDDYIWIGNISIDPFIQITEPGNYYVDYDDENNCTWRAEITIEAAVTPSIEVLPNEEMATLSIIGVFSNYLWNTGETTPSIEVTANGTYTVSTTDEYGCTSTASAEVVITDIERLDQNLTIEIYPNPFENELIVEGKELKGNLLQLYDLQGKLLVSKQLQADRAILEWKDLPNGMYVLKVVGEKGFWSEKVVKR
ncbi:MAG: T9SS type A sorting domain-containing protein, partial [Chitinophagales bacterium]